tara:strand:+ start:200 stop:1768 length:1569 start_codon:yes stop_codon:yes gene_type:complete
LTKRYDSDSSLREKILEGVDILADNVASTLGPRGRNVILQEAGKRPIVTKDGVTVAEFVDFEDPFMNAAVHIIKQASRETNVVAGDGTTTATVLAREIYKNAQKYILSGCSPIELKRGIEKATEAVIEELESLATPIQKEEDIAHVATISANNDDSIGKLIARSFDAVGKDGAITVEEARSTNTTLDLMEGFRFDAGYVATAFITNERRGAVVYDDPLILVTDCKVDKVDDILPVLELVARESRPLVIVASEIEGQALAALIMNTVRGTMKIAAVKAPRYGEERRNILSDLCLSTGAQMASKGGDLKMKDMKLHHLGSCKKIDVVKNFSTFIGAAADPEEIEKKINNLKTELENTDNLRECERIQERIARLASGVAILKVGAPTEAEMIEKKHRIEDALEAVKAAQEKGIIPGGGVALMRSAKSVNLELENEDQNSGASILLDALKQPFRQMAVNAGLSPDILEALIMKEEFQFGYDFRNEKVVDMYESGIIDPVKVTTTALRNAASSSGILITTSHAIVEN